jgi:hypothetical protein
MKRGQIQFLLLALGISILGLTASGCKEGDGSHAHVTFSLSPEAAQVLGGISDRLEQRASGMSFECNGVPSRDGRVACLGMIGSVSENTIEGEQVCAFGPETCAIRITGGIQNLQRALYESLEGTTPQLTRKFPATATEPEMTSTAYQLFLDGSGENGAGFEIYCTYTPARVSSGNAYSCITLVFHKALSGEQ